MNQQKSIWIVEDDPGCQFVYREILELRYSMSFFGTLRAFLEALDQKASQPDLIIADLRLPDASFLTFFGTEMGKALVARTPVLIVSSVDDLDILRYCFERGAFDYLTKPFGKGELVVKIERAFGRKASPGTPLDLTIDLSSLRVCRGGATSPALTAKELQVLNVMIQAREHTVTREQILAAVWAGVKVDSKSLDVHLLNLRRKIAGLALEIINLQGGSYRLLDQYEARLVAGKA